MAENEQDRNIPTDVDYREDEVAAADSLENKETDDPWANTDSFEREDSIDNSSPETPSSDGAIKAEEATSPDSSPESNSNQVKDGDVQSRFKLFFSKKTNRIIAGVAAALLAVIILFSTTCFHFKWNPATCTEPETCDRCGKTEGKPLGHDWFEATCTNPQTCERCGKTRGTALGHADDEWTVTTEATCTNEGEREMTCPRCKEVITESIPKLDHQPGDWEVIQQPTASSEGTRVRKCTVCGEEVERESFTMSPEEIAAQYKSECSAPSYDDVARNPDQFNGSKVKFTGKVIQVMESSGVYTLRVNVTQGRYTWDDTVMIYYIASEGAPRILEDDILTFYGVMDGMTSYESVLGATITLPLMYAQYAE